MGKQITKLQITLKDYCKLTHLKHSFSVEPKSALYQRNIFDKETLKKIHVIQINIIMT